MTEIARDDEFEHALDNWVLAAFARGVRSFPELVAALPGAYPTDIARTVYRLRGSVPPDWHDSSPVSVSRAVSPAGWPVEHPLDFDWRFTAHAAALLLDRCGTGVPLVFLGAPSLSREAARRGRRSGVTLVDRNPVIVTAVRESCPGFVAVCTDLVRGEPVMVGDAALAVADPPWYPEHTAAFLWAAARLTRVGGQVLLSLPPEGTRPGISSERVDAVSSATSFGLRLVGIEPRALAYSMPPFEHNALVAAGLTTVPNDWRHGDLATFTVVQRTVERRPCAPGESDDWDEEAVGSVRIKCRKCSADEFRDPTLSGLVTGDMLTSVSRRDPARAAVDVWTSGNRVYRCPGSAIFRVILHCLAREQDPERAVSEALARGLNEVETTLVRRAAGQAVELVQREEWELAEYGHRRQERDLVETV
ncbi:Uncharacterized protein OS=Candidatus Nitrososphaera evergladensis SR1 GN=NTE_03354 PE=4 SV=1 [Gemmata massiliana]|uniref:Uncharacterized protein n=1 Tax=Gemmata massiliana TaxID=1210884 RepID=A0A6P2D1V4_9BACT|nr:hypothetical protein [Gemmata massiliana]VTR93370.1 Uncharacterized protein OS=Candidatus Nitrososphaera evergladensis SR1 GN=NTE_03354 PE=4 SV=1 [Gemmata massiliana]